MTTLHTTTEEVEIMVLEAGRVTLANLRTKIAELNLALVPEWAAIEGVISDELRRLNAQLEALKAKVKQS